MARNGSFWAAQLIETVNRMRATLFMAALALFLASCETIQGAGRDITRAGEAIDDALTDNDQDG